MNGKYEAVDTVTTERGARTMTVDEKLHRVYLLAAEYGPAPEAKEGKKGRPPVLPDLPRAGGGEVSASYPYVGVAIALQFGRGFI